jgi:hypothetical protein
MLQPSEEMPYASELEVLILLKCPNSKLPLKPSTDSTQYSNVIFHRNIKRIPNSCGTTKDAYSKITVSKKYRAGCCTTSSVNTLPSYRHKHQWETTDISEVRLGRRLKCLWCMHKKQSSNSYNPHESQAWRPPVTPALKRQRGHPWHSWVAKLAISRERPFPNIK